MTLIEMTVVIMVLLSLVSLLFASSRAWKAGADRSTCIMHISNVQKAMRGHCNLRGHDVGDTVPGLIDELIGYGRYLQTAPQCPSAGDYTYGGELGPDTIPPLGTLYMTCSLAETRDHEPLNFEEW